METTIENKIKAKLQGAQSSTASQEMKNRMWANISKSVPQQPLGSGQGAAAAKSAAGELTKSVVKTKFFLGGMSKFTTSVIIGVVTATIGSVVLFNTSTEKEEKHYMDSQTITNTVVTDDSETELNSTVIDNEISTEETFVENVSKQKDSDDLLVLNETENTPEVIKQNFSDDSPSHVEEVIQEQNDAGVEIVEKEDISESFSNTVKHEKPIEQQVEKSEDSEQTDETDIAPIIEEPEETATVVVNRPVIIENKEVKIVKKKSRYSKKTRK